jgi:hypothetical protein
MRRTHTHGASMRRRRARTHTHTHTARLMRRRRRRTRTHTHTHGASNGVWRRQTPLGGGSDDGSGGSGGGDGDEAHTHTHGVSNGVRWRRHRCRGFVYEIVYCIRSSSSSNKYTNVRLYECPLIRMSAYTNVRSTLYYYYNFATYKKLGYLFQMFQQGILKGEVSLYH